jgi:hypothetical protein
MLLSSQNIPTVINFSRLWDSTTYRCTVSSADFKDPQEKSEKG